MKDLIAFAIIVGIILGLAIVCPVVILFMLVTGAFLWALMTLSRHIK